MPEVSFYHLTRSPLKSALPQLLDKVITSGKRAVLLLESEEKLHELDSMLWTFSTNKFLPHGTHKDGFAEQQPVFLTISEENPNNSEVLVVVDGLQPEYAGKFSRIIDIFDGNDDARVKEARERWSNYKNSEYALTYWQQDEKGAWQKAA